MGKCFVFLLLSCSVPAVWKGLPQGPLHFCCWHCGARPSVESWTPARSTLVFTVYFQVSEQLLWPVRPPCVPLLSLGCYSGLLTMIASSYLVGGGGVEIDSTVEPKKYSCSKSKVLLYQLVLVLLGRGCASSSVRALQKSKKPCASARSTQETSVVLFPLHSPVLGEGEECLCPLVP